MCMGLDGRYLEGDAVFWMVQSSNISRAREILSAKGHLPHPLDDSSTSGYNRLPSVYSAVEVAYESVMLLLVNWFMDKNATGHTRTLLDIGISRDGFHVSGLPQLDSNDYLPLIGVPAIHSPNQYPFWVQVNIQNTYSCIFIAPINVLSDGQTVLSNQSHVKMHWCEKCAPVD